MEMEVHASIFFCLFRPLIELFFAKVGKFLIFVFVPLIFEGKFW